MGFLPGPVQDNWRFCTKCFVLFWNGNRASRGQCAAGQGHSLFQADSPTQAGTSWDFALEIASTGPQIRTGGTSQGQSSAAGPKQELCCTEK